MNKKLIALAVAGACVVPAAMAQTANPVTLYGRVYETLESLQGSAGPTTASPEIPRRSAGPGSAPSRWRTRASSICRA